MFILKFVFLVVGAIRGVAYDDGIVLLLVTALKRFIVDLLQSSPHARQYSAPLGSLSKATIALNKAKELASKIEVSSSYFEAKPTSKRPPSRKVTYEELSLLVVK